MSTPFTPPTGDAGSDAQQPALPDAAPASPPPGYAYPAQPYPAAPQPYPAAPQPYPAAPQPYPAAPQPYPAAPQPYPPYPAPRSIGLAIAGLVTAIIPCTSLIGLALSIAALVQARRDGQGRGLAIAGTVVGALWVVGVGSLYAIGLYQTWQACQGLGNGIQYVDGVQYSCGY